MCVPFSLYDGNVYSDVFCWFPRHPPWRSCRRHPRHHQPRIVSLACVGCTPSNSNSNSSSNSNSNFSFQTQNQTQNMTQCQAQSPAAINGKRKQIYSLVLAKSHFPINLFVMGNRRMIKYTLLLFCIQHNLSKYK